MNKLLPVFLVLTAALFAAGCGKQSNDSPAVAEARAALISFSQHMQKGQYDQACTYTTDPSNCKRGMTILRSMLRTPKTRQVLADKYEVFIEQIGKAKAKDEKQRILFRLPERVVVARPVDGKWKMQLTPTAAGKAKR